MYVNITRISSKGQIVIPAEIRKKLNIKPQDKFLIFEKDDSIIFNKISESTFEKTFDEIAEPFRKRAKELGITRGDVNRIVHKTRHEERK